jgi:hypothetical protein
VRPLLNGGTLGGRRFNDRIRSSSSRGDGEHPRALKTTESVPFPGGASCRPLGSRFRSPVVDPPAATANDRPGRFPWTQSAIATGSRRQHALDATTPACDFAPKRAHPAWIPLLDLACLFPTVSRTSASMLELSALLPSDLSQPTPSKSSLRRGPRSISDERRPTSRCSRRPHVVVTCDDALSPVVKYHGLAHRFLRPHRLLMRPLLNGGTLGGRGRRE